MLSQFGKQIADLVASMTPSARIMAGLMAGVIVVSLGWILSTESTPSMEPLLGSSFTYDELARMEGALSQASLRGYVREGRQIKIPSGEKDAYIRALSAGNALPKSWGAEMDRALEASSVFESPAKTAMRNESARERSVAMLIERLPSIEWAAVEYDEKKTTFLKNAEQVCSVWVQPYYGQEIDPALLRTISRQVSNSFGGLPETNISVLDVSTGDYFQATDDLGGAAENRYLSPQVQLETKYKRDIMGLLGHAYGAIKIMVNAELDSTLSEESEKFTYDPTPVAISVSSSRKDVESQKVAGGGAPGTTTNSVPVSNQSASLAAQGTDQNSKTKESEESQRSLAGHTATVTKTAPLVPTKVTVTIGVPDSHFEEIWRHRKSKETAADAQGDEQALPSAAELAAIQTEVESELRAAVEGIPVGVRLGEETKPFIKVYAFTDLPVEPFEGPSVATNALTWLGESWSTVALLVVLLASLGMMFSWVRSQGDSNPDKEFAEGFGLRVPDQIADTLELGAEEGMVAEDGTPGSRAKFEITGAEIKDDLSTLINDNPEAAANLLKAWIGEAA